MEPHCYVLVDSSLSRCLTSECSNLNLVDSRAELAVNDNHICSGVDDRRMKNEQMLNGERLDEYEITGSEKLTKIAQHILDDVVVHRLKHTW